MAEPSSTDSDAANTGGDDDHVSVAQYGRRKLYDIPKFDSRSKTAFVTDDPAAGERLLVMIRDGIIGKDLTFASPFGRRKVVYCDYTASGRALSFLEDYIREEVLPHYGNTHTTTTVTSLQTTMFRDEARSIIRNSVNAAESDAVLFAGSGCTGAFHKLIRALNFTEPPIVFLGPYEHHSVILPWREIQSEIVMIPEDARGLVDLIALEEQLERRQGEAKRRLIGCFSAASNVTGILADTDAITVLLHRYNALAIWDYSACAPYVKIDMNPLIVGDQTHQAHKDAVVFSVHKFIGGVGTPGILIAKKRLFLNPVPEHHGGGTVFFVNRKTHRYLKEIENREEGGTAAIVEDIRAGLVFRLKDAVTTDVIAQRDDTIIRLVRRELFGISNLEVLGCLEVPRLPIFSFVIRHRETNRLLHHNFVAALLNDLFGIQSRAGCACAGPYAHTLLGIDLALAEEIEEVLMEDPRLEMHRWQVEFSQREVLRPGFVRINFPYFSTDEEIIFVCRAVKLVAEHGWKLLPLYQVNPETAEWRHKDNITFQDRKWLSSVSFLDGKVTNRPSSNSGASDIIPAITTGNVAVLPATFEAVLALAEAIFLKAAKPVYRTQLNDQEVSFDERAAKLRWFLLPSEARRILLNLDPLPGRVDLLFAPRVYGQTVTLSKASREFLCRVSDARSISGSSQFPTCCPVVRRTDATPNGVENGTKDIGAGGGQWKSPSKEIWKPMLTAISEFDMFKDGDRVLVCLSGGKDSLSLLHALKQYQFFARSQGINLELGAVTVDPGASSYDPSPLKPYLKSLGVPYFYEEQNIMEQAMALKDVHSICSFCSRMKRGRLYSCARREGYNVLAFGQHLDDLCESFMMSTFHNGRLRTMKACYSVVEGDLRFVRPLVYVREKDTRRFAESRHLPVVAENCPACFTAPKERFRVKQVLASQELIYPGLYDSLKTAMRPLMAIRTAGGENHIAEVPRLLDELYRSKGLTKGAGDAGHLDEEQGF
ncbi:putative tRNA 2-thiocytidine biosynthesis protein TtcA [Hypsibius exemplaris]|uniref:tRNA 2-thiocytidine biosynthesis protein TtcA n=1 Tax=Hypsibius exemplaris TaxID=2072580 RepID=A0A1W0WVL6_HYPEX|nr:putative tRNA 2-thiocytidine biosynthesis protein TtcA [Hypsibius exemplaris]